MNRTNLFRLIALLVLLCLFTAGCGDPAAEPETSTEDTTETTTEPVTSTTLGGKVPDMTFTTPAGEQIRLYDLLQEKKLVVLNFWFANCGWCRREFPVMEISYQRFREDVEILALNPYDSQEVIAAFQKENSLSFPMVSCSEDLAIAFGVDGYPTSVCIDREGTISLIHAGAITDAKVFDQLFETYTADDYRSRIYNSLHELVN
jgi:peroxiredoxin